MARENLMSLKAVPLQFAEFKPVTFTPAESNLEILNRSMEKIDAREKESIQAKDVMSTTLNEIRSKLNPEEFAKFDEKAQQARDEINTQIELGRYGLAMSTAYNLGRSFADDTEWQNKIRTQQERETKLAEMRQTIKDKTTADYFEELNPYEYDGTGTYKFKRNDFVEYESTNNILSSIAEGTPPQAGSKATERSNTSPTYENYGGETYSTGSTSSTSSHSSSYEKRTIDDMMELFHATLKADNKLRRQLQQNYEVDKYRYFKAIDTIEKIANLTGNTEATTEAINVLRDSTSSKVDRDNAIKLLTNNGVLSTSVNSKDGQSIKGGLSIEDLNKALEDYNTAVQSLSNKDGILMIGSFDQWANYNALKFFTAKDYVRITTKDSSGTSRTSDRNGIISVKREDDNRNKRQRIYNQLFGNGGIENAGIVQQNGITYYKTKEGDLLSAEDIAILIDTQL